MAIMFATVFSANAQIATENSKFLDNTYVGAQVGVATPMNFDHVFPLNTTFGVVLGKEFTPIFGAEIEGTAWFGSHDGGYQAARFDHQSTHNAFRSTYVGVNGTMNLTNLFKGYAGSRRFFEVGTNVGLGWVHVYTPYKGVEDKYHNYLGMKTAVDFMFNLGKDMKHTLKVSPGVYWNLSEPGTSGGTLAFNKMGAQVGLTVGYVYHFKTSNGTHNFRTYNVGALISENNRLLAELEKKPKEVVKTEIKEVEKTVVLENVAPVYVFFAKNSAEITDEAMKALDTVKGTVEVVATASPEGTDEYNMKLSQRRADVVKNYLEAKGVTVAKSEGLGVTGEQSNRVAIVTVK